MREMLEKIKRRDLLYLLGFLLYNLFILFVWKASDAELLVYQVLFAASLLSISLTLFTILYTWLRSVEAKAEQRLIQESLKAIYQQLHLMKQRQSTMIWQESDQGKIDQGVQLILQGLQQLQHKNSNQEEAKKKTFEGEQIPQVAGLSDLSPIYHTKEINRITKILNTYEIGDWFGSEDLIRKMQAVDPEKADQDLQNMILFYLAHLNLLGYIRSKNHQYTRIKEIPIIERKE